MSSVVDDGATLPAAANANPAVVASTLDVRVAPPAGARSRSNNFDAIRLFAALLVIVSHQLFFAGRTQPLIFGQSLGSIAVLIFLLISGYLVADSWYRDPHLVRFLLRRFLRIWPALAVATLVIALSGFALTTLPAHEYFGPALGHFIARNFQLRIVYDLPGVYAASPAGAMRAVNGSWWSIPLETKCYLYLAVLGLVGLRRRWLSVLALVAVTVLYVKTLPGHPRAEPLHNLKFLCIAFFMTGLCARGLVVELNRFRWWWLAAGSVVLVIAIAMGQGDLVLWVVLAPLVLVGGSFSTPGVRAAGRFGDLSYGTYVYAYFVQQLSVRYWPGAHALVASIIVAMLVTLALAWCSWHAVEAPALRLKHRLRGWFPDRAA
ncbi:MAG TPA: acyltransferase [Rhodanobacteraceae bacterium]